MAFEANEQTELVMVLDLYPMKESLDEAIETDSSGAMPIQLEQLDELVRQRSN